MEWRIRTVKCASLLGLKDSTAKMAAKAIHDFMAPLQPHSHDNAEREMNKALPERLIKLCQDAFDLILTLRECKDIYRCEYPQPKTKVRSEDVEVMHEEGRETSTNTESGSTITREYQIMHTVFGSLVKYSEGNLEKPLVLDKAHVVVKVAAVDQSN